MGLLRLAFWFVLGGTVAGSAGFGCVAAISLSASNVTEAPLVSSIGLLLGLLIGGLGSLVFLTGAFIYVFVPVFRRDLASHQYGSHIGVLSALVVAVVISLVLAGVIAVAGGLVSPESLQMLFIGDTPTVPQLVLWSATLEVAFLLVVYLRIIRPGVITWRQMGFTADGMSAKIGIGLAAGLGVLFVSGLLEQLLRQVGVRQTQSEMFTAVANASLPELVVILAAVGMLAPLAEEVFFRGYVFGAYSREKGLWPALLFSSLVFAVVHFNLEAMLPLFVVGAALAVTYRATGSLVPAIIAHGVNNCVAMLLIYLGPY